MIIKYDDFINENSNKNPSFHYDIKNYVWNDGVLDVACDVNISNKNLSNLPYSFGTIKGSFNCGYNKLVSLEGAPNKILKSFQCYNNKKLTNLNFFPEYIGDHISMSECGITSLVGLPEHIKGEFNCSQNELKSLEGCSKIIDGNFYCDDNKLTNLENGPEYVGGVYTCKYNNLKSLRGCAKIIDSNFFCENNDLTNLENGPKIVKNSYFCGDNPKIKSIEDYPRCIIDNSITNINHFPEILKLVQNNLDIFEPLFDDKVGFHQMVMRKNPDLIKYYRTISPPTKKTIL